MTDDPAPLVTFDPSVGDTLNARVGEALDIPFDVVDPGHNRLEVEYFLNDQLLLPNSGGDAEPKFTPIELDRGRGGTQPGVFSELGNVRPVFFTLNIPTEQAVILNEVGENSAPFMKAYIFREDTELGEDDFVAVLSAIDTRGVNLSAGLYTVAIVFDPSSSSSNLYPSVSSVVANEIYQCGSCGLSDVYYEFAFTQSSLGASPYPVIFTGEEVSNTLVPVSSKSHDYFPIFYSLVNDKEGVKINSEDGLSFINMMVFNDDGSLDASDYIVTSSYQDFFGRFIDTGNFVIVIVFSTSSSITPESVLANQPYNCSACAEYPSLDFTFTVDGVEGE